MTQSDLKSYVGRIVEVRDGQRGNPPPEPVWYQCEVLQVKNTWGHPRLRVKPVAGTGESWVAMDRARLVDSTSGVTQDKTKRCLACNDTGVFDTGNNELPCQCEAGDKAMFSCAWVEDGSVTGAEIKRHFLNDSPEPIHRVIKLADLRGIYATGRRS